MKVYFNTNTFDDLIKKNKIQITDNPKDAPLLVLGAKKVYYPEFTKLRAVYRFGVGSDNVDFNFLKKKNIPVYFPSQKTKDILYDSTANFTVYAILSCLLRDAFGDVNSWKKKQRDYLGDKTVLVIGTGNIGKRVVLKLKPFMKVIIYDAISNREGELEALIRQADAITVHIPLSDKTCDFFNKEKLSWVKDNAVIINMARGELFNEKALYEKLKNSDCHAFFDVFWKEPYKGKLKALGKDKFFMTPHSASNTKEFIQEGFNDILGILKEL